MGPIDFMLCVNHQRTGRVLVISTEIQSFQYSGTSFPPTFGVYKVCAQDERSLAHEERFMCPGLNVVLVSRSLFCFNVGLGFVKWPCDFSCQSPVSS